MTAPLDSPWLLLADVTAYARMGKREVLQALGDGSLRGHQVRVNGKWRVHRDDVDAWLRGEQPEPINPRFTRRSA